MAASVPRTRENRDRPGLINPMLGFLDRNLSRFSQPVRDTIGIGILLILVIYVVNGLLGPTYMRGQLWVNGEHAGGWRVLHGDNDAISNENGWWTLPLSNSGIPGRIRIEVQSAPDPADIEHKRKHMGVFQTFGPWPVWNTFRPMDNYVMKVDPTKPADQRLQVASVELFRFLPVKSVYAQSKDAAPQSRPVTTFQASCALSLNEVKVGEFPGFLRSSGRVYFQMYLDDKLVDGNTLLYGSGIGSKAGQFPVQFVKELWLPVRTGSEDYYKGLLANLTEVAACSTDSKGRAQIQPKGRIYLKMFADQGDLLNSFDLGPVLASPNQEITLDGDPKRNVSVKVAALVQSKPVVSVNQSPIRISKEAEKAALPSEVGAILELRAINVKHNGAPGSIKWRFDVFVNGKLVRELPFRRYERNQKRIEANAFQNIEWSDIPLPTDTDTTIEIRGYRPGSIKASTGMVTVARFERTDPVIVRVRNPVTVLGAFDFEFERKIQ